MPSRKRNKGKERKAKKAASNKVSESDAGQQKERQHRMQTEEEAPVQQLECLISNLSLNKCTHGAPIVPEGDIWNVFMLEFDTALRSALRQTLEPAIIYNTVADTLSKKNLFLRSTQDDYTKTMLACMVRLGTDYILEVQNYHMAGMVVFVVVDIEAVENDADVSCPRFMSNLRDLIGDKKNLTKFFMKRAKCDCLKELHKRMESNTTTGTCAHCKVNKERKELFLCTGCRVAQYCSEDCQRGAWPEHKDKCAEYKTKLQSD